MSARILLASHNDQTTIVANWSPWQPEIDHTCSICRDTFGPDPIPPRISHKDWVVQIKKSTCVRCRILLQAIQKLEPSFLSVETEDAVLMILLTCDNGRIVVNTQPTIDTIKQIPDIQLFETTGALPHSLPEEKGLSCLRLMLPAPPNLPYVGRANNLPSVAGDSATFSFLRDCLSNCESNHGRCTAAQDPSWCPTRLLRIVCGEDSQYYLQLVEMTTHKPSTRYIALSYCWGDGNPIQCTSANVSRLRQRINAEELPQTFQDCIHVAQQLSISYVWIDSLCILQDVKSDWARESERMELVFANAFLTVAAACCSNCTVPFLGAQAPSMRMDFQSVPLNLHDIIGKSESIMARRTDAAFHHGEIEGPLEDRAWAWQERKLSVRTISFTERQLYWECRSVLATEGGASVTEHETADACPQESFENMEREWRHCVTSYSARRLTFQSDRLPALSGFAAKFQARRPSEYLAGLWASDFPHALAWHRSSLSEYNCSAEPVMSHALSISVPSWSWASIAVEAQWPKDTDLQEVNGLIKQSGVPRPSTARLIKHLCEPSTNNRFGEVVAGGFIEVFAKGVEAEMEVIAHGCGLIRRKGLTPQAAIPDCLLESIIFHPSDTKVVPEDAKYVLRRVVDLNDTVPRLERRAKVIGTVICLLLYVSERKYETSPSILILSPVKGQEDHFERVGFAGDSVPRCNWEACSDFETPGSWKKSWEAWFQDAESRVYHVL